MKVLKNKFFLICLCIALGLCTASSTLSLMGFSGPVRNILGTVTYPVRWMFGVVADGFEGIGQYFSLQGSLIDRNKELEEENDRLREENERAQLIEEENRRLRDYLGMKDQYPSFLFEEGMIIGSEASGYMTVFTLNRGSIHGISKNMPVIVRSGIVGCVTEVGLNWCKVSTILESNISIGAYIAGGDVMGVIKGDYTLSRDGLCKMVYLNGDTSSVKAGDQVLSSGIASVYPADVVIGTVEAITYDEYDHSEIIMIRPSVDFSKLKYMMIVTGYEETENGGYQKPEVKPPEKEEENSGGGGVG
jgi:rod shape-determining protein MreC